MFNDFNRLILFFTAYGFCCFALFFLCLSFAFGVFSGSDLIVIECVWIWKLCSYQVLVFKALFL